MPLGLCEDAARAELPALAEVLGTLPLLRRYGMDQAKLCRTLLTAHGRQDILLVARERPLGPPCGLIWGMARGGLASAGYLRLLLVVEGHGGRGLGSLLMRAFEARCEGPPGGFFVLTEEASGGASFYARHGYRPVGPLADFVQRGRTELLLWKRT